MYNNISLGKYKYKRLPIGIKIAPDVFQNVMSILTQDMEYVKNYLDDLLILTNKGFNDHVTKLEIVLARLSTVGMRVNASKSKFFAEQIEYPDYWITRKGIYPVQSKVEAILKIKAPKSRKERHHFIGTVNYYRDMWFCRSALLAPLTSSKLNGSQPINRLLIASKRLLKQRGCSLMLLIISWVR